MHAYDTYVTGEHASETCSSSPNALISSASCFATLMLQELALMQSCMISSINAVMRTKGHYNLEHLTWAMIGLVLGQLLSCTHSRRGSLRTDRRQGTDFATLTRLPHITHLTWPNVYLQAHGTFTYTSN